jgi:hypothetical protein
MILPDAGIYLLKKKHYPLNQKHIKMKHFIILTILLAFTTVSFAQQATPNIHWKDSDLYKKSKTQKIVGWSLAGAGTIGFIVTLAADADQRVNGGFVAVLSNGSVQPEYKSYTAAYVISGAVVAGGVYLLFASAKNKNKAKAASVFIDMEKALVLQGTVFSYQSFPVVGVRIPL